MPTRTEYVEIKKTQVLPLLPLEGSIDLTYRCNNNCRHCWLRIPPDAKEKKNELSLKEVKAVVDAARKMGCRKWSISGGEPMIRPDFCEIFEYITAKAGSYSLNSNGTLITPKIAKLLKHKGNKMIALYGATAKVHDHITRNPGSFEAVMRGMRYLNEARAGFVVQLIPMQDNYHEFDKMVELAESLSKHYRIGAAWLYMSACRDEKINQEIARQRLAPQVALDLDKPDISYDEWADQELSAGGCPSDKEEHFFSACVASRRDFHIDAYGKMSFCCFIKDPQMRYDLRKGSLQDGWFKFIPSLAHKIKINQEHRENCGSCGLRGNCRWCAVYSYLEHGRYSAKIDYLCGIAKKSKEYKDNWLKAHRRYFRIADINIQIDSDLPITSETFHPKFKAFEAPGPGENTIYIRHHFALPDLAGKNLGKELYRKPPWAIYQKDGAWIYLGISPSAEDKSLHRVAVFNTDHTRVRIYNDKEEVFKKGSLGALTLFPTDQILLARILADRQGCFLHSCGVVLNGKGMLFVGHSEAGKSTTATMLKGKAEILCDDRIILRWNKNGFTIHGTWSHGTVPDISPNSAPLKGIFFLEKSTENRAIPITDKKEVARKLLAYLIKPFVTSDWWEKTLAVVERISETTPCYILKFDKSGKVVKVLEKIAAKS